jgi:hypothetical protein
MFHASAWMPSTSCSLFISVFLHSFLPFLSPSLPLIILKHCINLEMSDNILRYKLLDYVNDEKGKVQGKIVEVVLEVYCPLCLERLVKFMITFPVLTRFKTRYCPICKMVGCSNLLIISISIFLLLLIMCIVYFGKSSNFTSSVS